MTDTQCVEDVISDFEKEWDRAEEVTDELIAETMSISEDRKNRRSQSASAKADRNTKRSLSNELDQVRSR